MITVSQSPPAVHADLGRQIEAGLAHLRASRQAAEQEHRPTFEDTVEISAIAEAEWLGFSLGVEGFAVGGPAHYTADELAAFMRGHAAGFAQYEADEFDNWNSEQERLAELYETAEDRAHQAEVDRTNHECFFGRQPARP